MFLELNLYFYFASDFLFSPHCWNGIGKWTTNDDLQPGWQAGSRYIAVPSQQKHQHDQHKPKAQYISPTLQNEEDSSHFG